MLFLNLMAVNRRLGTILKSDQQKEWEVYLKNLRTTHARKWRLLEVLDSLGGKRVIEFYTKARGSEGVYYVCATLFSGWRIGHNINYQRERCYTGFRGSEHYGEVYLCLCTDKEMPPLPTDDTGYIKRR